MSVSNAHGRHTVALRYPAVLLARPILLNHRTDPPIRTAEAWPQQAAVCIVDREVAVGVGGAAVEDFDLLTAAQRSHVLAHWTAGAAVARAEGGRAASTAARRRAGGGRGGGRPRTVASRPRVGGREGKRG
eukprot:scaffold234184_cov37-Tisochrysis_lutea.AAC.8